jgi:prepilin-type N-terminal cleavage/methylation domain-containing protein
MKLLSNYQSPGALPRPTRIRGWTLVELMSAMAIFLIVVAAMISVQIFGFNINALTTSKLKFTAASLKALNQIQNQVRNANLVVVGNGTSLATFSPTYTTGNSLMIYPPTGSGNLLYLDTNADALFEIFGANTNKITIGFGITNNTAFQTVDCNGVNISSTSVENFAIRMTLQFLITNYKVPTTVYDCYTFQTEMTPRTQ